MDSVFLFKKASIYVLEKILKSVGISFCHHTKNFVQNWTRGHFSLRFWAGMIK